MDDQIRPYQRQIRHINVSNNLPVVVYIKRFEIIIGYSMSQLFAWNIIDDEIVQNQQLEEHFKHDDQPLGLKNSDYLLLINKNQMKIINLVTMQLQQTIVLNYVSYWGIQYTQISDMNKIIINRQNRNAIMSLKNYKLVQSFYHNYSKIIGTDRYSLGFQSDKKVYIFQNKFKNKLIRSVRKQQLLMHTIYFCDKYIIWNRINPLNRRQFLIDVIYTHNVRMFNQYTTQVEYRGSLYLKNEQQIIVLKTREIQFYNSQTGQLEYDEELHIGQSFNRRVLQMEWNEGVIIFYGKQSIKLPERKRFSLF